MSFGAAVSQSAASVSACLRSACSLGQKSSKASIVITGTVVLQNVLVGTALTVQSRGLLLQDAVLVSFAGSTGTFVMQ